jgi:hypothetical protein
MAMSEQLQAARTLLLKAPSQEFHEVLTGTYPLILDPDTFRVWIAESLLDIRRLVCNDALLEPICHDTFREFNTREMLQVPREDGKRDVCNVVCFALHTFSPLTHPQVLINSFAEISENEYIDYHSKTVITFDHITQAPLFHLALSRRGIYLFFYFYSLLQKITSSRPIILKDFDEELEPLRYAACSLYTPFCIILTFFRAALSDAVGAYVSSAYPRGAYGVYARKVPLCIPQTTRTLFSLTLSITCLLLMSAG